MDRLHLTGLDAGQLVRRLDPAEELPSNAWGGHVVALLRRVHQTLVVGRPLPLALVQEAEVLREGLGVQRGLDLEDLHAAGREQPAHPNHRVVDGAVALAWVHVALGVEHRLDVVVVLQRLVAGQTHRDRLVASVHGNQVDVHVDDEVGVGGALADLHVLALVGLSDVGERVLVLGVEVVELLGVEAPVHALAYGAADLVRGHPAVQRGRHDDLDVLDALARRELDHLFQDPLPDIRGGHGRQRERDVVDGDGELHAGNQEFGERLRVARRMLQGVTDGAHHVLHAGQRIGGIDHPRAQGELLHPETLALMHHQRWCSFVDFQYESGPWHGLS